MALTDKRYIYLAGKIKLGHGATEYRAKIAPILRDKFNIHSLDPLRAKYTMKTWDILSPNEVVVRDLQDIKRAHVLLAVMMKCEETSFGTPCEVMYAWREHIPVVMITNERYLADHFWTKGLCSNIFFVDEENGQTFDEVLLKVADHIGHWYGATVESEVYDCPTIAQEKPCPTCEMPLGDTLTCPTCNHRPADIDPDEEEARAAAASEAQCDISDGWCNTHDCNPKDCQQR